MRKLFTSTVAWAHWALPVCLFAFSLMGVQKTAAQDQQTIKLKLKIESSDSEKPITPTITLTVAGEEVTMTGAVSGTFKNGEAVEYKGISNEIVFKGKKFTELTLGGSQYVQVLGVDVAGCNDLVKLSVGTESIENALDLTNKPNLEVLNVSSIKRNYLKTTAKSTFDLSQWPKLKDLDISYVSYPVAGGIDLSKTPDMEIFRAAESKLKTLKIENNSKLRYLDLEASTFAALDLSGCENLEELRCTSCNSLRKVTFGKKDNLKIIDFSISPNIEMLDMSGAKKLETLQLPGITALKTLKLSGCENLKGLFIACVNLTASGGYGKGNGKLKELDLSGLKKLETVNIAGHPLTSLSMADCENIRDITCFGNQLKGENMTAFVNSVNSKSIQPKSIKIVNANEELRSNVCTKAQVVILTGKGWMVLDSRGDSFKGTEEIVEDPIEVTVSLQMQEGVTFTVKDLTNDKELTISDGSVAVMSGIKLMIKAQVPEGKYVKTWKANDGIIALDKNEVEYTVPRENVTISAVVFTVGVDAAVATTPVVRLSGDKLVIAEAAMAYIYNVEGALLMASNREAIDFSAMPKGVYIVRVNGVTYKVIK